MKTHLLDEFILSDDSLWVYEGDRRLFTSNKERLLPILEYIDGFARHHQRVIIIDRIMGNAAALLSVKAAAGEVYSPFGSELAAKTLDKYGIKYHFHETAQYIQNRERDGMCPMERLSIGKNPEEFFKLVRKQ